MKTVKQVIRYIKLWREPNQKEVALLALESARDYYKNRPHTRVDAATYQRAFIGAYRRQYAKNQIANSHLL